VQHHINYVAKNDEEKEELWSRYEAVINYAEHTELDLIDFVEHLEQLRKGVIEDEDGTVKEALLITSVHKSKGLEYPFVIMPGLSQGRFPYIPRDSRPWCIEDERRLFYVAMTRAQEKLVMISPNDNRLAKYLSKGADQPPESIEADPGNASQFIYETNLFLSMRADLLVNKKERIPDGIKSPLSAQEYLKAVQDIK